MSYEERISDEQLDHLIRMQDMLRCRMAGVLASDDGFHEGNVHAGTYRALVELKRLRRELAEACHQIQFIEDLILQHKAEQTADVRQVCSNMDAIIWAWAEDREGDLAPFLMGQP